MTLRDILCTACSDVALSVDEGLRADDVVDFEYYCRSCDATGKVETKDDGEQAMLVFRVESDQ